MTTVEALKALYVACGGALTDTYDEIDSGAPVSDYNVIPDCVAAIAEVVSAQVSPVPPIEADDDGKVLTVVSGAAAWLAPTPAPDPDPET